MSKHVKRVLIIEDDPALRMASEIALVRAGYNVITASSGKEGLRLIKAEIPDLIVLDLLMPPPTGLDVLRTIRADEEIGEIPVIVMSNSSMHRIFTEVESLGAEFIAKAGLSLRELSDRVERRLAEDPEDSDPAAASADRGALGAVAVPTSAKPRARAETVCAGCGGTIDPRFAFCPMCGRKVGLP